MYGFCCRPLPEIFHFVFWACAPFFWINVYCTVHPCPFEADLFQPFLIINVKNYLYYRRIDWKQPYYGIQIALYLVIGNNYFDENTFNKLIRGIVNFALTNNEMLKPWNEAIHLRIVLYRIVFRRSSLQKDRDMSN